MSERSERIMSQRAVRMPEPSASEAQAWAVPDPSSRR